MPDLETCKMQIMSEDYRDFIVVQIGSFWRNALKEDTCRQPLEYSFQTVYLGDGEMGRLPLYSFPYFSIPKCYTLLDMEALQQAGISPIQNLPGLELSGEGVLLGFLDTGINYKDPVFRNLDGSTRILRIWDQTIQSGATPEGLLYGSEYTKEQIDEALKSERPEDIVPSRDENGHGTFVASVACGGASVENLFLGAAPEATLAVVKLKEAKQYLRDFYYIDPDAVCYQENDIMTALFYLHRLAVTENMPLVICVAVGTSMGGHNGAAPLAAYMELLSNIPLIALTAGTGNEADKRHHYLGSIMNEAGEEIEFSVGNNTRGFSLELWTGIPNIFTVSITSPTGQNTGRIPIREREGVFDFVLEQTKLYVSYRLLVEYTNAELIFLQFDRPLAGIWRVRVEPLQLADGRFHVWLPMEEFLTGSVYFLRPNPEYTITDPGNTQSTACVAYYNGIENSIAVSSGRGYTRLEGIKPDFAAPGINVTGVNLRGQFTARSGSSIAVALAAGAEALLMEWLYGLGETPDSGQLKNFLILGAQRRQGLIYPNREWGYGTMNLFSTFDAIRQF